ncbi:Arc family DNA-binding protein [Komagataeibacter sp. FXV3]|uniref:Arc family DNA-binding protein n=1 Tax=Komagataeibacter sp. FXV3 TaxID=2608998 RepID=UPI00187BB263|nr:Arc family DNA-binding protein [Komagataeibacter sp. FXV3]MBE7729423.1 Arc family DNA-binding protein [Komagataeibacter sp. FXV3]
MADDDAHFRLRIPRDLKTWVEASARENKRSINAEILNCIELVKSGLINNNIKVSEDIFKNFDQKDIFTIVELANTQATIKAQIQELHKNQIHLQKLVSQIKK